MNAIIALRARSQMSLACKHSLGNISTSVSDILYQYFCLKENYIFWGAFENLVFYSSPQKEVKGG